MRVVVTGAGGSLGRVAVPALAERGHEVRLFDLQDLASDHEVIRGDVRDLDSVMEALDASDAVVHGAAIHGIHIASWPPEAFWSINATGTFNVYEAARRQGVEHVVLSSSMAVYGAKATEESWAYVPDDTPPVPDDVYGISKLTCEGLARYYARREGVSTVALRLGMFVPESFERYGFRLLFGGVDDRDVAQAVLLALDHEPRDGFDVFNIFADTPFDQRDAEHLANDPVAVVEAHWPGTREAAAARGLDPDELIWGWAVWSIDKAKRTLGYQPRHNFGEFLAALRRDDPDYYPFAGLARWGVDGGDR